MGIHRVSDITFNVIKKNTYDIGVFASGYEERCTYIPKNIQGKKIINKVILGFKELTTNKVRKINDAQFVSNWGIKPIILSADNELAIYETLRNANLPERNELRVLVDYSSMSRLWYAAIINWCLHGVPAKRIVIDFAYAVGKHRGKISPFIINNILSIPGCEGGPISLSKSVTVFGLGFDGFAPLCVLDQIEPDIVYSYLAAPAAFNDYPRRAYKANIELIEKYTEKGKPLELPLDSVELVYTHLAELISPHRNEAEITMVPMGPKPHVLASLLLSFRFKDINCLRVSGKRAQPEKVGTTGQIVSTRVEIQ